MVNDELEYAAKFFDFISVFKAVEDFTTFTPLLGLRVNRKLSDIERKVLKRAFNDLFDFGITTIPLTLNEGNDDK